MNSESEHFSAPDGPFRLGDVVVDPRRMVIESEKDTHHLTDLTWRFLMALIEGSPNLVTYERLAKTVWKQGHVSDETISQRLRQLRQALDDDPKAPRYVRTIRGQGYQLIAKLEKMDSQTDKAAQNPRLNFRRVVAALAFAAIFALWISRPEMKRGAPLATSTQPSLSELTIRADEYRIRGQDSANETAIGLYEKALTLAPNNQRALVGLSFSFSHKASKYDYSTDWAAKAATLADRAILNDPHDAAAFEARGLSDDVRGRISSALRYYKKSLELNPQEQSARSSTAYLLQIQGHFFEALKMEKLALDQAASTYFAYFQIAVALDGAGLVTAAQSWLERAELLRPDIVFLTEYKVRKLIKAEDFHGALNVLEGVSKKRLNEQNLETIALLLSEQDQKALESNSRALELASRQDQDCYQCLAIAAIINPSEYLPIIKELPLNVYREGDEWPQVAINIAYIQTASGQPNAAIAALERAYALGYRDWKWLEITPLLNDLKSRAEFQTLTAQMQDAATAEKQKILSDPHLTSFFLNAKQ